MPASRRASYPFQDEPRAIGEPRIEFAPSSHDRLRARAAIASGAPIHARLIAFLEASFIERQDDPARNAPRPGFRGFIMTRDLFDAANADVGGYLRPQDYPVVDIDIVVHNLERFTGFFGSFEQDDFLRFLHRIVETTGSIENFWIRRSADPNEDILVAYGDDMLVDWQQDFLDLHTPRRDPTPAEWEALRAERAEMAALLQALAEADTDEPDDSGS